MDVAASEFYKGGKYDLDFKSPDDPSRYITPDQLADLYKGFVKDYPGQYRFPRATDPGISCRILPLDNVPHSKVQFLLQSPSNTSVFIWKHRPVDYMSYYNHHH